MKVFLLLHIFKIGTQNKQEDRNLKDCKDDEAKANAKLGSARVQTAALKRKICTECHPPHLARIIGGLLELTERKIATELVSLAPAAALELGANPNVLSLFGSLHCPELSIL